MASIGIRMRMVRSSSQGEIGLQSHLRPLNSPFAQFDNKKNPVTVPKPVQRTVAESKPKVAKKEQQQQPCVFTIGSPERKKEDGCKNKGLGEFFKNCCLCKKQLARDKHVFCYGDSSFCSPGCRDDRIALDGFDKEPITLTNPFADYVQIKQQQKNQRNSGWCPVKKWCTKIVFSVLTEKDSIQFEHFEKPSQMFDGSDFRGNKDKSAGEAKSST